MADYRNLEVWQVAHSLTLDIYRATVTYPSDERYGLTSQTRRAAASIPMNLAEGSARGSDDDYARFVRIANGSASEVEYQLRLAKDLGYLDEQTWPPLADGIGRIRVMLDRLHKKLKSESRPVANSRYQGLTPCSDCQPLAATVSDS